MYPWDYRTGFMLDNCYKLSETNENESFNLVGGN